MLNKTVNIFENIDFNAFSISIGKVVKEACEKFWEQDIKISMQAKKGKKYPKNRYF